MSDDGHLTKLGAKRQCLVCCQSGHTSIECPAQRCYVCFETGHEVKDCPWKEMPKCEFCLRLGHTKDGCVFKEQKEAARWCNSRLVRCGRCGEEGHPMCRPPPTGEEVVALSSREEHALYSRKERALSAAAALIGRGGSGGRAYCGTSEDFAEEEANLELLHAGTGGGSHARRGKAKGKGRGGSGGRSDQGGGDLRNCDQQGQSGGRARWQDNYRKLGTYKDYKDPADEEEPPIRSRSHNSAKTDGGGHNGKSNTTAKQWDWAASDWGWKNSSSASYSSSSGGRGWHNGSGGGAASSSSSAGNGNGQKAGWSSSSSDGRWGSGGSGSSSTGNNSKSWGRGVLGRGGSHEDTSAVWDKSGVYTPRAERLAAKKGGGKGAAAHRGDSEGEARRKGKGAGRGGQAAASGHRSNDDQDGNMRFGGRGGGGGKKPQAPDLTAQLRGKLAHQKGRSGTNQSKKALPAKAAVKAVKVAAKAKKVATAANSITGRANWADFLQQGDPSRAPGPSSSRRRK